MICKNCEIFMLNGSPVLIEFVREIEDDEAISEEKVVYYQRYDYLSCLKCHYGVYTTPGNKFTLSEYQDNNPNRIPEADLAVRV